MKKIAILLSIIAVIAVGLGVWFCFDKGIIPGNPGAVVTPDDPNEPETPTQETCMLILKVNNSEYGRVETMSGVYAKNREVFLKASAINNSSFVGWYLGEELLSAEQSFNFMLKADSTIIAKFKGADVYTKNQLAELVKTIDLTTAFKDLKITYTRDYAEIRLLFNFAPYSELYPNFSEFNANDFVIGASDQMEVFFDLDKNFKKAYLKGDNNDPETYLPVQKEISKDTTNAILNNIPFSREKFTKFVSISADPVANILSVLHNSYSTNGAQTANIASIYQIEVDPLIPIYDCAPPVLVSAGEIKINVDYSVDDTVPKDPNLDDDGDYVFDATELFDIDGFMEYNPSYPTMEWRICLRFKAASKKPPAWTALLRSRSQYVTTPDSDTAIEYEKFVDELANCNFTEASAVKSLALKNSQTASLNSLWNLFNALPKTAGTYTVNVASLFNFYDASGAQITNIKFNVQVEMTVY